jgi:hypothetical protein
MVTRILKSFEQDTHREAILARLQYGEFLLKQRATLKKRQVMRYFAMNFFHDGEVHELSYLAREKRLRLVLRSAMAVNCAWDRAYDACRRDGLRKEDAYDEASRLVDREDFVFQVDFVGVEALRVLGPPRMYVDPLKWFWCGELRDATEPELSPGTTWLVADFVDGDSLEIAFRTAHVIPLKPEVVRPCLVGRTACKQLLRGRSMREALLKRMSEWRDHLQAAAED